MRILLVIFVSVCFVWSISYLPAAETLYDVETLAKLNVQYWNKLERIDLRYVERQKMQLIDRVTGKVIDVDDRFAYRWLSSNTCDILQTLSESKLTNVIHLDAGPKPNEDTKYQCWAFDGKYLIEHQTVGNATDLGRKFPSSLMESFRSECRLAIKSTAEAENMRFMFPKHTVFCARFRSKDPLAYNDFHQHILSLENKPTTPQRSVDKSGDVIWTFRITFGKVNTDQQEQSAASDNEYVDISINESKGFILSRVLTFTSAASSNAKDYETGESFAVMSEISTTEYVLVKDNIYFPSKIVSGFGSVSAWQTRHEIPNGFYVNSYEITNVKINEQVTENPCFVIPEFYEVFRYDLQENKSEANKESYDPISIWGKNNEPLITFYSDEDYRNYSEKAYLESIAKRKPKNAPIPIARIIAGSLGVLILLIVYLIRRYKPDNPV